MSARQPSRVALAIFDWCVRDHDALRGDLLEEMASGRSSWWLWRQVFGAIAYQRPLWTLPTRAGAEAFLAGSGLLLLICFEAVFVTNVVYRVAFGPPFQNINGYAYFFSRITPGAHPTGTIAPLTALYACVTGLAIAVPAGWLLARLHVQYRRAGVWVFSVGTLAWAVVNLSSPFPVQFISMLSFVLGLLLMARARDVLVPFDFGRSRSA
jgi:hypothetical protein